MLYVQATHRHCKSFAGHRHSFLNNPSLPQEPPALLAARPERPSSIHVPSSARPHATAPMLCYQLLLSNYSALKNSFVVWKNAENTDLVIPRKASLLDTGWGSLPQCCRKGGESRGTTARQGGNRTHPTHWGRNLPETQYRDTEPTASHRMNSVWYFVTTSSAFIMKVCKEIKYYLFTFKHAFLCPFL